MRDVIGSGANETGETEAGGGSRYGGVEEEN